MSHRRLPHTLSQNEDVRLVTSAKKLRTTVQNASLRTLIDAGMTMAIGSDNIGDSSVLEAEHLHSLGVVDTLALLKLWTEDTPRSIFPQRRIGFLREGFEASFLALEGSPLADSPPAAHTGPRSAARPPETDSRRNCVNTTAHWD